MYKYNIAIIKVILICLAVMMKVIVLNTVYR